MLRMTHLGGPTVLLEIDGWRILTDPTFDPPGRRYGFGWGTASTKTTGPALGAEDVGPVDLVLLSHDHHADNLDDRGRDVLAHATTVLTTRAGARRLAGAARGLRAGESTTVDAPGRQPLVVRGTPCRHGPPLSRPVAGSVVGFAVSVGHAQRVAVWMTGDTVLHRPLRRVAAGLDVDVLLVHTGAVRFPLTGPLRYSMDGGDAVRLTELVAPRVVVPVHYEGWSHFTERVQDLHSAFDKAGGASGDRVLWLEPGRRTEP